MGSNGNDHDYIQCGCHNPVWEALKDTLDPASYIASHANAAHGTAKDPSGESLVFHDGIIYPLRDGNMEQRVEALGIHAGDVVASGTLAAVEARMQALGIEYKRQSLQGKTLLPGLVEPHAHIVQSCAMDGWLNLGAIEPEPLDSDPQSDPRSQRLRPVYNWNWLKETIQSNLPEDSSSWVLGHLVDPALMPFKVVPGGLNQLITLQCGDTPEEGYLDTIEAKRPMLLISASMHSAYMNTAARDLVHEKTGIMVENGVLQETQIVAGILSIPAKQKLQMLKIFKRLDTFFQTAASRGITLLYDAMMDPLSKLVLNAYFLTHPRTLRIGYAAACNNSLDALKLLPDYRPVTREEAKHLYQGSIKVISDGSNQGLTGYQVADYCCKTDRPVGNFNLCDEGNDSPKELPVRYRDFIHAAVNKGWPLMIHANGDRAIEFTLQAYDLALQGQSGLDKRHRIEHCSLLTPKTLKTMQRLGLSPSFLIGHVGYWGYAFDKAIFESKAQKMLDLCKSALDHELRISLHSDYSVTPLGPLRSMEQAVTRKMEGIRNHDQQFVNDSRLQPILNEAECLTRQQALKAITYDAAWQCHAEAWTGSLQDGNFADFVILDQNPLDEKVPATQIRDIKIRETWKGGQRVYLNPRN
ncbi:amidohydrolase family protein [Pseudomonas chlororaphis]|uniref:amidohydrolase n=1 Tax=Pseudomonas chlororaphis TaxID=587753 RepID=UPI00209BB4AD|nr:amidohydrolase family protein [Pseudomonas chlororaphis]MCO7574006.1 amidohydrolase family protein [Pseudomonas chlororaphis]MCO7592426.1 amidohydrolase family protein [Pseudomonas chlororaphis]